MPTSPVVAGSSRRTFLQQTGLAAAGALTGSLASPALAAQARKRPLFAAFGIVAPLARAAELKAAGADYLVERVADYLMPAASDADFAAQRERAKASPLPVVGCNVFLPPGLKCVGPEADQAKILAWADVAFRRLQELGGRFINFGSGGARRIPDGWTKEKADEQFLALLKALGPMADKAGVTIAVEQLRAQETNYLNRLAEVVAVVKQAGHPRIRVLADLYHMIVMGDGPEELGATAPFLAMVEIAEKVDRKVPGVNGDDFRPYFRAIARAGYTGPITIEGNGTTEEIGRAFTVMEQQAREAA